MAVTMALMKEEMLADSSVEKKGFQKAVE